MPNQQKTSAKIAVIGIDIGKATFHLIGQDERGAIVMRAKVSRRQLFVRLVNLLLWILMVKFERSTHEVLLCFASGSASTVVLRMPVHSAGL